MDPQMLAMMVFTIVVLAMIGGLVVLFPIVRRLGRFLEYRMSEASRAQEIENRERMLRAIEALRDEVAHLAERQDFTERLLERPRPSDKPEE